MQQQNITPVNFASHLAALLQQHGLTQKQFANEVNVSQATVVKWLKGSQPLGDALNRAAAYFQIHPDYLLNPARYTSPLALAKAASEALDGTPEEKQAKFEEVVKAETAKLKEIQSGGAADSGITDAQWKRRALAAERKLEKLRSILEVQNPQG